MQQKLRSLLLWNNTKQPVTFWQPLRWIETACRQEWWQTGIEIVVCPHQWFLFWFAHWPAGVSMQYGVLECWTQASMFWHVWKWPISPKITIFRHVGNDQIWPPVPSSMHQTIQGDPRDGWDELKPDRSYLSHFATWYSKSTHFSIEMHRNRHWKQKWHFCSRRSAQIKKLKKTQKS